MECNPEMKTNEEAETPPSISETAQVELLNEIHRLYLVEAFEKLKNIVMPLKSKPTFYLLSCSNEPKDIKKVVKTLKRDLGGLWGEQSIICTLDLLPGTLISSYVSQMQQCDIIMVFCTPLLKQIYETSQPNKLENTELSLLFTKLNEQKSKIVPCCIGSKDTCGENRPFFLQNYHPALLANEKDYLQLIFYLLEQAVKEPDLKELIKARHRELKRDYKKSKNLPLERRQALLTELRKKQANAINQELYDAVKRGDYKATLFAIQKQATVNYVNDNGRTPLIEAASKDDRNIAQLLLQNGAEINTQNKDGWTALHEATLRSHIEMIKLLIEKGADINCESRDNDGRTPFHEAIAQGIVQDDGKIVELLIEKGANVNYKNKNGWTPLAAAGVCKHSEKMVKLLLDKGADVNCRNNDLWTPLHEAAAQGRIDLSKLLIDRGANVNCKNHSGQTPLAEAANRNYTQMAQLLLQKGAEINAQNKGGWTPLAEAIGKGYTEMVRLLIENGAEVNCRNNDLWTPLHEAAARGRVDLVKLLINKGANVNCENFRGESHEWSPLHQAIVQGYSKIVRLLIKAGADVDCTTKDGWTVLTLAIYHNKLEVVKVLLQYGIDPNHHIVSKPRWNGWTPLCVALNNYKKQITHSEAIVEVLLQYKADPNHSLPDGTSDWWNGWTPLCTALFGEFGFLSAKNIELLLNYDANPNHQLNSSDRNEGWTPLMLAISGGENGQYIDSKDYETIIKLLLDEGANPQYCFDNNTFSEKELIKVPGKIKELLMQFSSVNTEECSVLKPLPKFYLQPQVAPQTNIGYSMQQTFMPPPTAAVPNHDEGYTMMDPSPMG